MITIGQQQSSACVVDMTESPYCVLRPVPVGAVRLEDEFWEPRIRRNREITIPSQLRHCEQTGRIDNFRRAAGKFQGEFQGIYFNDSDVYKWVEAASWSLVTFPDAELEAKLDGVIAEIGAAQDEDGYLNTYFTFERKPHRFSNLKDMHEIYCAGHLFQAAVAHHRATGKESLLGIACRLADHLWETFGPGGRVGACGHEEAEMGLVELYRITRQRRYLELSNLMIEVRGQTPAILGGGAYHQDHLSFKEQTEMIGHAVRHLYLCCGAADVNAETGDEEYSRALDTLWSNFTQKKMYITGGAGSRYEGEAFGNDYELPNERAYAETCAAIGSVMWNWRMLHLTGWPQYADVMEISLYNGVLPGVSLDGTHYFYENPLADRGKHRRQEWFGCACCPPNIARMLASLPGYFCSTFDQSEEGVAVHLYARSTATMALNGGGTLGIRQETDYPWSGDITLHIEEAPDRTVSILLRIPFWADEEETLLFVNGVDATENLKREPGTYCSLRREWKTGDKVRLVLPMPVEKVESHPRVTSNRGRVALQRGPLVYCVEQADCPEADVWDLVLPDDAEFRLSSIQVLDHNVVALSSEAIHSSTTEWQDSLYAPYAGGELTDSRSVAFSAIPYFAWANREAGPMQVWIPVVPET